MRIGRISERALHAVGDRNGRPFGSSALTEPEKRAAEAARLPPERPRAAESAQKIPGH
jgi:hypothetical protein